MLWKLLLIATMSSCAMSAPKVNILPGAQAVGELDTLAASIDEELPSLREVDLGRTFAADHLRAYYGTSAVKKIEGIYGGLATEHSIAFYVASDGAVVATVAGPLTPVITAERYYLLPDSVVARDNGGALRLASGVEGEHVRELYRQFDHTVRRAADGKFDDPAAFERE